MTLTLNPTLTLIPDFPDDNANHLSTHHSLGHKIRLGVVWKGEKEKKKKKAGILTAIIMGRLVRWGRSRARARADTQIELVIEVLYVDPAGRLGALGLHIGKALVAVMACVALRAGGPSTLVSLGVGLRDQHSTADWWKQLGLSGDRRQSSSEVTLTTLLSNVSKFQPHSDLTSMLTTQSGLTAEGEGGGEEEVAIEEEEEEEDKTDDSDSDDGGGGGTSVEGGTSGGVSEGEESAEEEEAEDEEEKEEEEVEVEGEGEEEDRKSVV